MKISPRIGILFTIVPMTTKLWTVTAYQPDGKPSVYKTTLQNLQGQFPITPLPPLPPGLVEESTIPLVDDGPPDYWFHPKIHTFGNSGPLGAIHASVAPLATKLIDVAAYDGENVRDQIARELSYSMLPFPSTFTTTTSNIKHKSQQPKIVDLACGVGMSTRALHKAFPHASQLVGIDTSSEMIGMAKALNNPESVQSKTVNALSDWLFRLNDIAPKSSKVLKAACNIEYKLANAEDTGLEGGSFDLATIM